MERLIENALIYGSMVQIDQPHLVERYNQALTAFGLANTKRNAFSVDAMGFSPEIAKDLKDDGYLDPLGVNRRFIIVSPEQADMPVVNISFSSTPDLMRAFYVDNAEAIRNLTLKDVVYGEIEDASYRVDNLDDVLSIKRVKFNLHTHDGLLEKSRRLAALIETFETDADAWQNDELLGEIVDLARACGDIRYNQIAPQHTQFDARSFWTRHFDGIYVFHDEDDQVMVVGDPTKVQVDKARRPQDRFIAMSDLKAVLDYLTGTGRVEPLNLNWLSRSNIVDIRFGIFCRLQMSLHNKTLDPSAITDVEIGNWVHKNLSRLKKSKVFRQLHELQRVVLNGSRPDTDGFDAEMMLMSLRANPDHDDWLLVNRFLSEFVPYDFLTRFIVNKQAFYRDYETFSDAHREYAVRLITATFFPDKQELWSALFERWRLSDA